MNHTSRIFALAILAGAAAVPAYAEIAKRTALACLSEELLDEATNYAIKRDTSGTAQLIAGGKCLVLQSGEQISVISPGFAVATIRYRGAKMFTVSEAVR